MSEWVHCERCGTLMENLCACPTCEPPGGGLPPPPDTEPANVTIIEPCDHDWQFVDESFSHEFGTEVLGSWECLKCGEITTKCPVREYDEKW